MIEVSQSFLDALSTLRSDGDWQAFDAALARSLAPHTGEALGLAAGAISARLRAGDTAVAITDLAEAGRPLWPTPDQLMALPEGPSGQPVERLGPLVQLARVAEHERTLCDLLLTRAAAEVPVVDAGLLDDALHRLFPPAWRNEQQEAAVRAFVGSALTILAGGPGTGKTTTVVRMLAAHIEQELEAGRPAPEILVLAPTGKAAARLSESIAAQRGALEVQPEVLQALPSEASTVHRALKPADDWLVRFRRDRSSPLVADVVVVDEVSMLDLVLFRRLMEAIPAHARVVLIGDPDQLPSVGGGAVLEDLTGLASSHAVGRRVARLTESRRFAKGGGIATIAQAVLTADAEAIADLSDDAELTFLATDGRDPRHDDASLRTLVEAFRPFAEAATPQARLDGLGHARVLCATHKGRRGVQALNEAVEAALAREGLLQPREGLYDGQPIMIQQNDYAVDLYNGDVGVICRGDDGTLRAWFQSPSGGLRSLAPGRLPAFDTVFAMTVHKSQGSEFRHVLWMLPDRPLPLLDRGLAYTAITRAREHLTVFGARQMVLHAAMARQRRVSGIPSRLSR